MGRGVEAFVCDGVPARVCGFVEEVACEEGVLSFPSVYPYIRFKI